MRFSAGGIGDHAPHLVRSVHTEMVYIEPGHVLEFRISAALRERHGGRVERLTRTSPEAPPRMATSFAAAEIATERRHPCPSEQALEFGVQIIAMTCIAVE